MQHRRSTGSTDSAVIPDISATSCGSIGTDTVSQARLGAAHVTGLRFSPPAVAVARHLALDLQFPVNVVYTGIGVLCWLPDIDRWANVVFDLLAPGGRLFLRERHPVLWSLDYDPHDMLVIGHPYFETAEPIIDMEDTTYVETESRPQNTVTHSWNHGFAEQMVPISGGEWVLKDRPARLPLNYTLQAVKG